MIVDFNTAFWIKPWIRKAPHNVKFVFLYLWTNNHKNLSALYEIDIDTISYETGFSVKEVKHALKFLSPDKILYDYNNNVVWVRNYVKRQFLKTDNISPSIVKGIIKALIAFKGHPFYDEFYTLYTPSIHLTGKGKGKGKGFLDLKEKELFDKFWEVYPKKRSKGQAEKTWANISPSESLVATIIAKIELAKTSNSWVRNDGKYIPHPSTWLAARGWEDEYRSESSNPSYPKKQGDL